MGVVLSPEVRRPLTRGLAGSSALGPGLPSSAGSRFRLVEELIEAGESGRDNGATPLSWGGATAGEAMAGGAGKGGDMRWAVEVRAPKGGMGWPSWILAGLRLVARFAFAGERTLLRGTATPKSFIVGGPARWAAQLHPKRLHAMERQSSRSTMAAASCACGIRWPFPFMQRSRCAAEEEVGGPVAPQSWLQKASVRHGWR